MTPEQRLLIEKSREFAENVLIEGKIPSSVDEYCIFCVGRFMLTKELVLRKNHQNQNILFDCSENSFMIGEILNIGKYVIDNSEVLETNIRGVDSKFKTIEIEITPESERTPELVKALWIINKIRDSIAHGKYTIDFENKELIINNDQSENDCYGLVCKLPIEILNKLFISTETNDISNINMDDAVINNIVPKVTKIKDSKTPLIYNRNISLRIKNSIDILTPYFKKLMESYDIDQDTKSVLLAEIRKLIEFSSNTEEYAEVLEKLLEKINKDEKSIKKPTQETVLEIIQEMSEILKKSNSITTASISLIAMHNYLQNLFAFTANNMNDRLYLVDTTDLDIRYTDNKTLDALDASIKKMVEEFVVRMETCINSFSHKGQLMPMRNDVVLFYEEMINKLNNRNALILSSVRNGVEHSIISETRNGLVIRDMANQQERSDIKFTATGSYDTFYDIATTIEIASELTPSELINAKEEFINKKIIGIIIKLTGDVQLGLRLHGCLSVFYGMMHRNNESLSVQGLIDACRKDRLSDLKSLLEYRELQQSGLVM